MIIAVMFVAMLLFFAATMFIKQASVRVPVSLVFAAIFVVATGAMTANYNHHIGMHKVTTTTSRTVYPVRAGSPLALYQPLGTDGTERVLIYKNHPSQKKPSHTPANEHTESHLKFAPRSNIKMTSRTTRWETNPGFASFIYRGAGTEGKLVHQDITITYPRTYVKVTTKQARKLAKAGAKSSQNPQARQAAQQYVMGKVQAARAKNPRMSKAQMKEVQQQATAEYQARMIRQMLKK